MSPVLGWLSHSTKISFFLILTQLFVYPNYQTIKHLQVSDQSVFLTLDACGGPGGRDYDEKLISFLTTQKISATLFISALWATENPKAFNELKANSLFEIESHGYRHRPLSREPKKIYGLRTTTNAQEVFDEIVLAERFLSNETGRKIVYFRPAALFVDPSAEAILNQLSITLLSFTVNGDAGASFSVGQMEKSFSTLRAGDIIICHMNHPEGQTAEGLEVILPTLIKKGFVFQKLEKYLPAP